jgi:hypothetical protein
MKRIFTFMIALLSMFAVQQSALALTYSVTVPAGTNACFIAGNMNGWSQKPMTKVDATHYTIDYPNSVATDEYKYCSGPDWKYEECDAAGVKLAANRKYAAADVVANWLVVYDTANEKDVTIEVLTPATTIECYIVGNFNGWASPAADFKMTKGATTVDGIVWTKTVHTLDVTTLEYKFTAGPAWDYQQSTPSANFKFATDGGTVIVTAFKAIFDPSKTGDIHITATVPAGTTVCWIQGSYLGWDMTKAVRGTKNADGTFSFTVPMVMSIEYRLYNLPDWSHPEADDAGVERANRLAAFPADANISITVVKWKTPVLGMIYNVTVPAGTNACFIAGNMNGWSQKPMTKVDATHYTINYPNAVATDEYKYCSGPDWKYEECDAAGVKLAANRKYEAADVVANWLVVYDTANEKDVTIEVLTPATTIECYIVGNFNGWASPAADFKMTKGATTVDGIVWTKTIHTLDITTLEFKFAAGPAWDYEQKTPSANFKYATDGGTVIVTEFKAIFDPAKTGDIHITATVPAGTTVCWIQGSYLGWDMTKAVKGTKNEDGTFSFTVPMVMSIEYRLYNLPDWSHPEADDAGKERANRLAAFPADANISITVVKWKLTTAISIIKTAPNLIYTRNSSIVVEGVTSRVDVFDLSGRILQSNKLVGTFTSKSLNAGIYIVRVDGATKKVAVQ